MEVSRRRIFQKHLEPARPLRRCSYVDYELQLKAAACGQAQIPRENNVSIDHLYNIVSLHEQKKARISYTREFLIGLASCPEAKIKPAFLPENPIVLSEPRDPSQLELGEVHFGGEQQEMST